MEFSTSPLGREIMKRICSLLLLFSLSPAFADISVIVNPANSDSLSEKDIQRIFLGKTKSFPSGGEAKPLNVTADDPLRGEFDEKVLGRSSSQVTAYWSKLVFTGKGVPPTELGDSAAVLADVAGNAGAIGYVDSAAVTDAVKVVATF